MWRLTTRVHQTWHLTAICFGFIGGVVLAMSYSLSTGVGLTVGLVCIVLAFWKRYRAFLIIAVLGGVCLGLVRGSIGAQALSEYRDLYGHQANIEGVVAEDVDTVNGSARLRLNHVKIGSHNYQGQVWVTARSGGESVRRSDVVKVNGMVSEGFGNFAASIVGGRIIDVHRPVPGDVALEVRDAFARDVRQTVSEPGASLGLGFLLGQKNALPTDLLEALKITGLTHIVVASGYNLTILVRIGRRLFAKLSKYLAVFSSGLMIGGFIAITGLSPSMTRAGLVAILSLWAWYFGRKFHPITLLSMAAALTILWNPSYVWGDVGWLLSFGAFAGVMIVAPLVGAYFFGNDKPPLVIQILFETAAATIATIPIIITVFGQFSNVALLSNMLILPFIPITMLFTAIAGIGGIIHLPILGWVADHMLAAMTAVVSWCADLPWAQSSVQWPLWGTIGYIFVVVMLCVYMRWRTKYNLYAANIVE